MRKEILEKILAMLNDTGHTAFETVDGQITIYADGEDITVTVTSQTLEEIYLV